MQQPMISEDHTGALKLSLGKIRKDLAGSKNFRGFLLAAKLLAGITLLIVSVRGIRIENLITGIRSANITWLALAICAILAGLGLKLWRWGILVKNYQIKASQARLFSAYFVGQATNIVLPVRAGELVRAGYIAGNTQMIPRAASTIILEKYLDLLALTVCGILVSINSSLEGLFALRTWLLPLTAVLSLLLLGSVFLGPVLWRRIRNRMPIPPGWVNWLDQWLEASQWLRHPQKIIPGVLLTITIWVVMWLTNLLLFKSLGLTPGNTAAGMVLFLVYIGLFPALMPGNIGPFYFFARLALYPFGILNEAAVIFAVLLHAIVTLPPLLGGAIGLLIRSDQPRSL